MELAELLEREGLDPDELMTWARRRADTLVAGIVADPLGEPLLRLLTGDGSIDIAAVPVAEPAVAVTAEPTVDTVVDAELEEDTVVGVRHELESSPLTVDELPPPPDPPQLAEGEPEPILETFDTGPIDLETPEAAALMAAAQEEPPAVAEAAELAVAAAEDELEEIEFDELVEIAEEELEELDEIDEPESPLPPRRPPPPEPAPIRTGDTASFPTLEQAPIRTGDTATHMAVQADDELEDVDLDAKPGADEDGFDLDLDAD